MEKTIFDFMHFNIPVKFYCLTLLSLVSITLQVSYAQDSLNYIKAERLVVGGKAKTTLNLFQRIDKEDAINMPKPVQSLAMQSAGIYLIFETNSTLIAARWKLGEEKYMANMTPIAHSGLDLYCLVKGKWQYVNVGKPAKGLLHQDQVIVQHLDTTLKRFMLYLPLYNAVNELEIGVDKKAVIGAPKNMDIAHTKRIVVYGSSIVQGASASRPGMAYPAIMQRKLGFEVINLGFSGNAKMEIEVAQYLATVPADFFVLDCIPNQSPEQVSERAIPFIKYLKAKRPNTPIVILESVIRETGYFDQLMGKRVQQQNENIKQAYLQLKKEKYTGLFYISADQLTGKDHEATIDGTHLTDLGFVRIADAVMKVIKKAM